MLVKRSSLYLSPISTRKQFRKEIAWRHRRIVLDMIKAKALVEKRKKKAIFKHLSYNSKFSYTTWNEKSWNFPVDGSTNQILTWFLKSTNFQQICVKFAWHFGHFFTSYSHLSECSFAFAKTMNEKVFWVLI